MKQARLEGFSRHRSPGRIALFAAVFAIAVFGLSSSAARCGGSEGGGASPTLPGGGTPLAAQTVAASQTAQPMPTETPIPSAPGTVVAEAPTSEPTAEPPSYEEIGQDLERLRAKYPEAEKLFYTAVRIWERAKKFEEAGDLSPAGNDYFGVWGYLVDAYNGTFADFTPNMTCDAEILEAGQRVRLFIKAEMPELYESRDKLGAWDPLNPLYGPGCRQP